MTIGDYIKEKLSIWSVEYSSEMIELELSKLNLSSLETITGETNLDLFFYNVIPDILSQPDSVSEGGYSVSYNKNSLVAYYRDLAVRLGKPDFISKRTIRDASNKW